MLYCNVYRDMSHFYAKPIIPATNRKRETKVKDDFDIVFLNKYSEYIKSGLKNDKHGRMELFKRLAFDMYQEFGGEKEYVSDRVNNKLVNLSKAEIMRLARFDKKVSLYKEFWTHFGTVTYDSKKFTEEEFIEKFKTFLGNVCFRYGWIIAGKFEVGDEGRKHFHCVARILPGSNFSQITKVHEWNYQTKEWRDRYVLNELEERFGRTDFIPLTADEISNRNIADYVCKYTNKSDGECYYSRGIPSGFCMIIDENEITAEVETIIKIIDKNGEEKEIKKVRYVLADDVCSEGMNSPFDLNKLKKKREIFGMVS